jgi:disulfide oxidoreductase YuzD
MHDMRLQDTLLIGATVMANRQANIQWLDEPEDHDYPAALSYLSLIYDESSAAAYAKKLKQAPMSEFKSKDIFRASGLSLLGISNGHVKKDTDKIDSGKALSPLLLVRDSSNGRVIIADGYHRLCAVYGVNEDAVIPCKIV